MERTLSPPPRIVHLYTDCIQKNGTIIICIKQLLCDLKKSVHLNKSEFLLLQFYCNNKTGFRPAAKTIMQKTKLPYRTIFRARQALALNGLIYVDAEKIAIDWRRLMTLASLDPALTGRHNGIRMKDPTKCKRDYSWIILKPLKEVINRFSTMSEQQLSDCITFFRNHKLEDCIQ